MAQKNFNDSADIKTPPQRMMETPDYLRLGRKTHVGDDNEIQFERPCLELRRAYALPVSNDRYKIVSYWQLNFNDALDEAPEDSSTSGDPYKLYTHEQASAELIGLMQSWKGEGYVIDNISPAVKPAAPAP